MTLPELHLADWRATKDALHLYAQIVGKIRLATTPPRNHSWDRAAIERFGRVLDWSDSVLEEFSGWFNGKTSPVHLFWHSLDLAVTRFSGRPYGPLEADLVTREAYSHEVVSFGFWAGDDTV